MATRDGFQRREKSQALLAQVSGSTPIWQIELLSLDASIVRRVVHFVGIAILLEELF